MSAIGTMIVIVVSLIVLPFTLPKIFGLQMYGILTGSMEPACPVGSLVYVKKESPEALKSGDIITFNKGNQFVTTHRVVKNDVKDQLITTKGDANNAKDIKPVPYKQVLGKVILTVPLLGSLALKVSSVSGISLCIILLAVGLILWVVGDMMKAKEKTASEEGNDKKSAYK